MFDPNDTAAKNFDARCILENLISRLTRLYFQRYGTFIKYCLVGCSGVCLDFLCFLGLTMGLSMHYQAANILSVHLGMINNFFWNRHWTFQCKDKIFRRFLSFYAVGLSGLTLMAILLHIFIDLWNWHSINSKIVAIIVATIFQFILNKTVTFKQNH